MAHDPSAFGRGHCLVQFLPCASSNIIELELFPNTKCTAERDKHASMFVIVERFVIRYTDKTIGGRLYIALDISVSPFYLPWQFKIFGFRRDNQAIDSF
jgi:hypothetical protein